MSGAVTSPKGSMTLSMADQSSSSASASARAMCRSGSGAAAQGGGLRGGAPVWFAARGAAWGGVDVGDRTGLASHGVLGTHAMTWAWSIRGANWSQLACLRPPGDADHAAKVPGQQWVAAARADRDDQKIWAFGCGLADHGPAWAENLSVRRCGPLPLWCL